MMNLKEAKLRADQLLEQIRPHCIRAELAGSIRREKESGIKDIELVCVPKWDIQRCMKTIPGDLFREISHALEEHKINTLHEWATSHVCAVMWIKPGISHMQEWPIFPDGKYWRGLLGDGQTKLDLFLTTPENFGAQLLIRTGSAQFSQAVVTHARDVAGMPFAGGYLTRDGENLPTYEEEEVFEHLGLRYVEPKDRHGWEQVKPL